MKIVQISKENWADGLAKLSETYRLFGPVKEDDFHNFKQLDQGQLPDLSCLNTRLSPKSIIYPQTEVMFEYSLDENQEDHHILKEAKKDYSPQAVIGIRPCDAKAFGLVRLNFDTPEYQDPYWLKAYEATTLVGRHQGEGRSDLAYAAGKRALVLVFGFTLGCGLLFALLPEPLARLFTSDARVSRMAASLLYVAAVIQVFCPVMR